MSPEQTTVVLLAAGHGKRMLPLTKYTPKPLLKVGKLTLIEHHLTRLAHFGFRKVVINIAYLSDQITQTLGSGERYGLSITYSDESSCGALETAGGLKQALPLIDSDPFLVINADIWTDFDFRSVLAPVIGQGRLVMVKNPAHNPDGDFCIHRSGQLINKAPLAPSRQSECPAPNHESRTFSGIAVYRKTIFDDLSPGVQALAPLFRCLISDRQLEGSAYDGEWADVGTPERLEELNQRYKARE